MPKFADGVVRFQNEVFPAKQELFEQLSHGQAPEALFIACSDSRIDPAMVTQTDPGELFICRNPGNIVPPHTRHTGGTTASIEFAVSILKVQHIVLCGHTGCGAMKAAVDPELLADTAPFVSEWLDHTQEAVKVVNATGGDLDPEAREQLMLEQNVVLQMKHLEQHPSVVDAMAQGRLTVHGWIYDIKTGGVTAYDTQRQEFLPVSEFYAD